MSVGRRIRDLRTGKKMSQSELAAPLFTHAYISSIESGKRNPSDRALQHFARKLEMDLDELRTGRPAGLIEELELELLETRHLVSSGDIDDARRAYRSVLKKAGKFGLDRQQVKAVYGLGLCDERSGSWEEAIDMFERGERDADTRFPDLQADLVTAKARCFQHLGDTAYAVYLLDRTIRDLKRRNIEDPVALAKLYAPLSSTAFEAGFFTQASEASREAIRLANLVEDPMTLAVTNVNVARVLLAEGERQAAMNSLARAEELFDQLRLTVELGRAHLAHGFALSRGGDRKQATHHLDLARDVFHTTGSALDEGRTLVELARVNRSSGKNAQAIPLLESAIDLLRRQEHVAELALANRELGLALFELEPERAQKSLQEAIDLYERADAPMQVALTYRYLGELRQASGGDGCGDFRTAARAIPEDL